MRRDVVLAFGLLWLNGCPGRGPLCPNARTGRIQPTSLLMLEGVAEQVSFQFDGPGCALPAGALNAEVELTDESGARQPVTVLALSHDVGTQVVTLDLRLPPLTAGTAFLKVFVDPTIALLQLPVFVAADRTAEVGVVERFPAGCRQAGRTTAGTVLCFNGTNQVTATRAGLNARNFTARSLQVIGNVAWLTSLSEPNQVVRLEDSDGGLRSTTVPLSGMPSRFSFVDEQNAVFDDQAIQVLEDGGMTSRLLVGPSRFRAVTVDRGDLVGLFSDGTACNALSPTCEIPGQSVARFVAYDQGYLWLTVGGALTGLRRPLLQTPAQTVDVTMPFGFAPVDLARFGATTPQLSPGPLVLVHGSSQRPFALRLRITAGQPRLEALTLGTGVVAVTRDWLTVGTGRPGELRFIPLTP